MNEKVVEKMRRLNVIVIIDGPHTMPETSLSILFTSINSLNLNGKNKQTNKQVRVTVGPSLWIKKLGTRKLFPRPESTHLTPTLLWENEIKTLG